MSDEFTSIVVGPKDWLVLVPRQRLEHDALRDIVDRLPAELRGRVLVTCDMDAYVVQPSDRCHHCGQLPEADGDHSCPCPHRDQDCPPHRPVGQCDPLNGVHVEPHVNCILR